MSEAPGFDPLVPALRDTCCWLEAAEIPAMLIGGVAAAILGRPRFTRDIDIVVLAEQERWPELLADAVRFGLLPRVSDSLAFAVKHRVLLLRHGPSNVSVDISFGALPFEREAIARALRVEIGGIPVALATPEDLIIMKAVAHRTTDWADVEAIVVAHPDLDLDRVRRWTSQFAEVLEAPEILEGLEAVLARRRSS